MTGRRIYLDSEKVYTSLQPGEYCKYEDHWICRCPTSEGNLLGTLDKHTVVEHEDGSISVTPSILCSMDYSPEHRQIQWHGFLERGVWRSA